MEQILAGFSFKKIGIFFQPPRKMHVFELFLHGTLFPLFAPQSLKSPPTKIVILNNVESRAILPGGKTRTKL